MNWSDKKVIFVTGKGGTGKSTIALALAIKARAKGLLPLLVETDMLGIFGQLVGRELEHDASELLPGVWACKIDFFKAIRDYISHYIPAGKIVDLILKNTIIRSFLSATPSARELVAMSKVKQLYDEKLPRIKRQPDIVIVDMPASGHAYLMLKAPRVARELIKRGPLNKRAEEVDEFLRKSGRTGVLITALPEELAVREAIETHSKIGGELGYNIIAVVMNFLGKGRSSGDGFIGELEKLNGGTVSGELKEALSTAIKELSLRKQHCEYERELEERISEPLWFIDEVLEGNSGGVDVAKRISEIL
ncbi:MAG: hypothetical protein Kow0090_00750 [Myxococcota bacterium]